MINNLNKRLEEFARLAVEVGVNIKPGQPVQIKSSVEAKDFARLIAKEAYKKGAGLVEMRYMDPEEQKLFLTNASDKYLVDIPDWEVEKRKYFMKEEYAIISISSPDPTIFKNVDPSRISEYMKAFDKRLGFYTDFQMASGTQWTIVAWPNIAWAKTVFPNDEDDVAMEKLMEAILNASRVRENNDVVLEWKEHMDRLSKHSKILNDYNFKTLNFKNSLGTDLTLDLVENHIWAGGAELSQNGVIFAPNIPTEEVFTMPHKDHINGKVVSTKPLNYQGKLIKDFYLVFKDGHVVEYDAKEELSTLKALLEMDEGSSSLGEVALISNDSPISNLNILFSNTLFDENASCHLALGNAYTMNIKNGNDLPEEELMKKGYNKSLNHVDFMFGSSDMEIEGITQDGKVVPIFRKGNFVF